MAGISLTIHTVLTYIFGRTHTVKIKNILELNHVTITAPIVAYQTNCTRDPQPVFPTYPPTVNICPLSQMGTVIEHRQAHGSLYFSDGNIVLTTVGSTGEHVLFRVHQSIL